MLQRGDLRRNWEEMGLMIASIPGASDVNDDEAIMRAARHDRSAFAPIYERYVDPIYRFCYRRLGDQGAAEDATSRIFERAIKALPRYRSGSVRAWLFTIARNTITDLYRQQRPVKSLDGSWEMPDRQPGPEAEAIANDQAVWVRTLLDHLNPDQRAVIELRLAGLSNLEISEVLGKSHTNVRVVTYRALRKLRAVIEAEQMQTDEELFHASQ
jgi:RNA polymerase sigma-70 factor, ECF subfamily